jgi:seryl-tRNA synthetase
MSALQKLQIKLKQWKKDHQKVLEENQALKKQLYSIGNREEIQIQKEHCATLQNKIDILTAELEEKDEEIEKVILQVEAILE